MGVMMYNLTSEQHDLVEGIIKKYNLADAATVKIAILGVRKYNNADMEEPHKIKYYAKISKANKETMALTGFDFILKINIGAFESSDMTTTIKEASLFEQLVRIRYNQEKMTYSLDPYTIITNVEALEKFGLWQTKVNPDSQDQDKKNEDGV